MAGCLKGMGAEVRFSCDRKNGAGQAENIRLTVAGYTCGVLSLNVVILLCDRCGHAVLYDFKAAEAYPAAFLLSFGDNAARQAARFALSSYIIH